MGMEVVRNVNLRISNISPRSLWQEIVQHLVRKPSPSIGAFSNNHSNREFLVTLLVLTLALPGTSRGQDIESSNATFDDADAESLVRYVTTDVFEEEVLKSEMPVLVDFTAEWCVPCRIVDPIIESLMPEMKGRAKVFKLDIDESPEIYAQLRVNGVPHVLFFSNGREQERISSPQSREIYVEYLNALIEGTSAWGVTVKLLDQDAFRRHYILSKNIDDIASTVTKFPGLLTRPFENRQTPLSLILNHPSVRQDELIEMTLAQDPTIRTNDLVGLGRCQEFETSVHNDPNALNRLDPDGNSPLMTAMARSYRLENDCVRTVLDLGPDLMTTSEGGSQANLTRAVILLNDDELLERFLELGWNPENRDTTGRNALHWAALYGYTSNARTLISFGVDKSATTSDGETAAEIVEQAFNRRKQLMNDNASDLNSEYLDQIEQEMQEMEDLIALLVESSEDE